MPWIPLSLVSVLHPLPPLSHPSPMSRGAQKHQGSARYFQPRMRDHTPSHIHSPSSPAREGDAMALRAQKLPKSRAGGVPCAGSKTTEPHRVRSTRPQAVLPSCAHTHLHSQRHLHTPACSVPLRGAQRLPTAAASRWKPQHVHSNCLESGHSSAAGSHPALGLVLSCRGKSGVSPTPV